jgi:cyclic-di-AMP phosphodiesterase PgpH
MISTLARFLENRYGLNYESMTVFLNRLIVSLAAAIFIILSTMVVAFEDVFPMGRDLDELQAGDIAPEDIRAPETETYISAVRTDQQRQEARENVNPIYETPNQSIVLQQNQLSEAILNFIDNIRRDPYGTTEQKVEDLQAITAVDLDEAVIIAILELDNETWRAIEAELPLVIERVYRNAVQVREDNLSQIRNQVLRAQVATSLDEQSELIIALARGLIQPNTILDEEETASARLEAADRIAPVPFTYERNEIIVGGGQRISEFELEAIRSLGLLNQSENRVQGVGKAFLASVIVMVVTGLYTVRFRPSLLHREPRFLTLLAIIFLIVLAGARLGLNGEIYIYPTAVLALLYVAIIGPEIAVIGALGIAFLVGIMADGSLEITTLVAVGGLIGALTLRRAERLNNFFFAGIMVALSNMAVTVLFNLNTTGIVNDSNEFSLLLVYSLLNGVLTAAAAMAGLYIITVAFNLPTALKLAELMQPNQPLLQRLLREAPGTYQHSLQVANLAEQATNAIGANSELTHVAALYHDIGKMNNPAFFTENQRDIGNPHDALNDPYRSADIIISHATEGDEMARQYRLPHRMRDFIREHHGTSQVYVFYKQAVILAGEDEALVNIDDFTYPGPKPHSRETAALMLADSCEAAVRSRQPKSKQEIEDIVNQVIEGKRKSGQLDSSGLTLNDLNKINNVFIEILQGMFHPRIDYDKAISRVRGKGGKNAENTKVSTPPETISSRREEEAAEGIGAAGSAKQTPSNGKSSGAKRTAGEGAKVIPARDDDDDAPLAEVPRLRRTSETKAVEDKPDDVPEDQVKDE